MKVWEQLAGRRGNTTKRSALDFQDWVDLFSFNGSTYPLLQQTMPRLNEESMPYTGEGAFRSNSIVFALVQARLQVFSQARFAWTRFSGGKPTDLFGTPDLSLFERPWPGGTTGDLLARMEIDNCLAGNAFIRRTGRDRLNRLRPDWMTIVLGSNEEADHPSEAGDVEVIGYVYAPGGGRGRGRQKFLLPEEVAHYAPLPDPANNFLGMSWITPCITDVQGDSAQSAHKRAFLTKAATPNLAIKFDPSVAIEQVREFKEILEGEHQGYLNAYKTLYLGGGADPVVIGKDFREIDFAVTQGKGESRLASAAGVPPSWVGFSEGLQGSALNAGNFNAARRRFGDGTMQHLWGNVATSLERIVSPPVGASLWYDVRGIAFMREDAADAATIQQTEASTIVSLTNAGFTWESAVQAVQTSDWSRLIHTGLMSVQLQPPGATPPTIAPPGATPPTTPGGAK